MYKKESIPDELLARYLEGNVTEEERQEVLRYLEHNQDEMFAMLIAAQEIAFQQTGQERSKGVYERSLLDKSKLDDDTRYAVSGHGKVKIAADSTDGKVSCAIQAQQLVLSDFGIFVSTDELLNIARTNGWFIDKLGSPLDFVGELLNYYHIPAVQMRNANIYHLINELSQGHKVIVGIDVNDLSQNEKWHRFDDVLCGKEANHVLVVAGIDTGDPNETKIVLSDPSRPGCKQIYSAKQFMNAWEDSGYFMVATAQPAPLQFNPEMQYFDYQTGHLKKIADMTYREIIKRLADDGYIPQKDLCKPYRRYLFFVLISVLLLTGAIFTWLYLTPFNMKVTLTEDSHYQIPELPFESGTLVISYAGMQPQRFHLSKDNLSSIVNEIDHKYRGTQAHIKFYAERFQPLDTVISIRKNIHLTFRHDNSLSLIFGTVISARDGQPLADISITVQDMAVKTDNSGYFCIKIPYSKQNRVQTLKAYKEGYLLWSGTYEPSPTNGWDIVMEPQK